jgi:hypothetical protein
VKNYLHTFYDVSQPLENNKPDEDVSTFCYVRTLNEKKPHDHDDTHDLHGYAVTYDQPFFGNY